MPKKTKQLPSIRVEEALYSVVQQVAEAQDISQSEVMRLALIEYCTPKRRIPVLGTISDKGIEWFSNGVQL